MSGGTWDEVECALDPRGAAAEIERLRAENDGFRDALEEIIAGWSGHGGEFSIANEALGRIGCDMCWSTVDPPVSVWQSCPKCLNARYLNPDGTTLPACTPGADQ